MAIFIILLAFLAIWILIDSCRRWGDWRIGFLFAVVATYSYLVIITELLSLIGGITRVFLLLGWFLPILIVLILQCIPQTRNWIRYPRIRFHTLQWLDWLILFLIGCVLLVVGIVAFLSPPNNPDVLRYHLPRVAHWAQNASLHHFPSGRELLNSYPPAAEYAVLHLYILGGGDQWVKFSAWFILLASAVSASLFAEDLRLGITAQTLAALFVVTLPVAIMQGSSVKNDLHVAFWTLLLATFIFVYFKLHRSKWILLGVFSVVGLGFMTKPNTLLFMAPVLVWFGVRFFRMEGFKKSLHWLGLGLLVFALLNGGWMLRNLQTYGFVIDREMSAKLANERISFRGTLSNLLRNATFHLQLPWEKVRDLMELFLIKVHAKLGLDINDRAFTSEGYFAFKGLTTDENLSGNTLHTIILVICLLACGWQLLRKRFNKSIWFPILTAGIGYLVFSMVVKWQVFGARYTLPVFFLLSPVFGYIMESGIKKGAVAVLVVLVLALSFPWLFTIENRPIFPRRRFAAYPGILTTDRMTLILGANPVEYPGIDRLPDLVEHSGCKSIGIYGSGGAPEYWLWAVLGMPRKDLRIEWLVAETPSEKYSDPQFNPCLIACADCPSDLTEIRGLNRVVEGWRYDLFIKDEVSEK